MPHEWRRRGIRGPVYETHIMILQSNMTAPHRQRPPAPRVARLARAGVTRLAPFFAAAVLFTVGCGSDHVFEMGSDAAGDAAGTTGGGDSVDVGTPDAALDVASPDGTLGVGDDGLDDGLDDADGVAAADSVPSPDSVGDGAAYDDVVRADAAQDAAQDDSGAPPDGGADADAAGTAGIFAITVEATLDGGLWDQVERLRFDHDALAPETYIAKTRQRDEAVIAAFGGDAAPPPERFLLHAAAGWDTAVGVPVLLVHGAGSHATESFADPDPAGFRPGMAAALAEDGRPVFAVTFPARFGDNVNQALELAAALQRVREKTGAARVDVVAHSKGGVVLLAYLGGLLASRGVPYQADVRRVILAGAPMGGTDFSFRHPNFNYSSAVWGLELPSSWDQLLLLGVWQDRLEESIYGGAYQGLVQTLVRWDDVHALSMLEQDWYTTYEGGYGFVSHSLGIDAAIEMGDQFMARLRASALPAGLPVALLVGSGSLVNGVPWETTGPSDGLVFVASAADTEWLEGAGAVVTGELLLDVNHWELLYAAEAIEWIRGVLTAE